MTQESPKVTVLPAVFLKVDIEGRVSIYDVPTAQRLQRELTIALNQLDTQERVAGDHDGSDQGQLLRTPRDRNVKNADVGQLVAGVEPRRGA